MTTSENQPAEDWQEELEANSPTTSLQLPAPHAAPFSGCRRSPSCLALVCSYSSSIGSDLQPLFDALLRIGFGFFFVLAISGSRHVLRTIAMAAAVPAEHRRFNFFQAFAARLGGEAISFLTFTGPLLGEATKVALLRKRVPLTYGVPALVVDNLIYNLSVVFFILSGACVMLFTYQPAAAGLATP